MFALSRASSLSVWVGPIAYEKSPQIRGHKSIEILPQTLNPKLLDPEPTELLPVQDAG